MPGARNLIRFSVSGAGMLKATDNGRSENAAGFTSPSQTAFFGQALAVVGSAREPGVITLTATAEGLAAAKLTLRSVPASGAAIPGIAGRARTAAVPGVSSAPDASNAPGSGPTADASFSGQPGTLPATMLDGDLNTYWPKYYNQVATANILAVSVSNPSDWVSLSWPTPQRLTGLTASFTTGGPLALPASVAVTY